MEEKGTKAERPIEQKEGREKPKYVPPKIVTYTSEEILEQIGPAMACSPSPCPTSYS
jgi:hypothetical protein